MLVSERSGIDCHISTQAQSFPITAMNVYFRQESPGSYPD